ncbi:unnamed protein product [Allacma fusca]|uniref:Ribosome assembly factor mrt4 n=1 Tax=Allacma fusca TaxID=39272 RepID=A0A8J2PFM3_9HEXA|nr:unnamed protein product [Allacma fusca]
MPKSKRDKKVSLTKTAKHGMDWKKKMVEDLKSAAAEVTGIYAFEVQGMRTAGLTELRNKWRGSKIFLGKNKIMTLALGKDEQSELKENLYQLANRLRGSCGLLFTDEPEEKVVNFFENFVEWDYARCGNKANETVVLEEGKLKQFPHSIEPHLRSLGLPTSLQKGVVTLIKEYTVCKKGQVLNANQAKILKLLEKPMAEFKILLDSRWKEPNDFKIYPQRVKDDGSDEENAGAGSDNEMVELDDEVEVLDENEEMEGTTEDDTD